MVRLTRALLGRSGPQQPQVDGPWTAPQPKSKLPGQHRRRPLAQQQRALPGRGARTTWAGLVLPRKIVLATHSLLPPDSLCTNLISTSCEALLSL